MSRAILRVQLDVTFEWERPANSFGDEAAVWYARQFAQDLHQYALGNRDVISRPDLQTALVPAVRHFAYTVDRKAP